MHSCTKDVHRIPNKANTWSDSRINRAIIWTWAKAIPWSIQGKLIWISRYIRRRAMMKCVFFLLELFHIKYKLTFFFNRIKFLIYFFYFQVDKIFHLWWFLNICKNVICALTAVWKNATVFGNTVSEDIGICKKTVEGGLYYMILWEEWTMSGPCPVG